MPLLQERRRLPDAVYAALQAIPGIYAGEPEIRQWGRWAGKTVTVVNADGGACRFPAEGGLSEHMGDPARPDALRHACESADLALFRTAGHWERVVAWPRVCAVV